MRVAGFGLFFRGVAIVLLIAAILGITTATLMPVIYQTDWFKQHFPHSH